MTRAADRFPKSEGLTTQILSPASHHLFTLPSANRLYNGSHMEFSGLAPSSPLRTGRPKPQNPTSLA